MFCSDHVDELYRLIRSPADVLFRPRGRAPGPSLFIGLSFLSLFLLARDYRAV